MMAHWLHGILATIPKGSAAHWGEQTSGSAQILPVLALKVPCPRNLLSPRSTEAVGHLAAPGSIVLVDECHSVELRVAFVLPVRVSAMPVVASPGSFMSWS